jgi:hypothetical protein
MKPASLDLEAVDAEFEPVIDFGRPNGRLAATVDRHAVL